MKIIFLYLAFLNLFDGAVTFWGLQSSIITEFNPLMHSLYDVHPVIFLVFKLCLSCLLLAFVIFNRVPSNMPIRVISLAASVLYTSVILLHGFWIFQFFT